MTAVFPSFAIFYTNWIEYYHPKCAGISCWPGCGADMVFYTRLPFDQSPKCLAWIFYAQGATTASFSAQRNSSQLKPWCTHITLTVQQWPDGIDLLSSIP